MSGALRFPDDRCASCGADRETIGRDGHGWVRLAWGRFVPAPADSADRRMCEEACSCIPECFSMDEHEADR